MVTLERTPLSFEYAYKGRAPCAASVLASFGIKGHPIRRTRLSEILSALRNQGRTAERIHHSIYDGNISLTKFMKSHPQGSYVIYVSNHFMSLIDGRLTDTNLGKSGKRQVREVWEVWEVA